MFQYTIKEQDRHSFPKIFLQTSEHLLYIVGYQVMALEPKECSYILVNTLKPGEVTQSSQETRTQTQTRWHFKLITRDFVERQYSEYRRVSHSNSKEYDFLWCLQAFLETVIMKVLKFVNKIHRKLSRDSQFQSYAGSYQSSIST
ncbi:hypothetical protein HPG69_018388 [Diceros bicornis minor]|uniref:MAGE domain-containing protein n=1 Tax=Diceros bicornis minor TaxID=77932 RepID=A0A7J7E6N2_DICBM|nr:hypothetical protein HPG69_018388 [Diceros bicornis minor]